jgi:hypothetical protein
VAQLTGQDCSHCYSNLRRHHATATFGPPSPAAMRAIPAEAAPNYQLTFRFILCPEPDIWQNVWKTYGAAEVKRHRTLEFGTSRRKRAVQKGQ